jgi:4a-hydroxytetrahydrobiopterin dehydratase
MEELKEMHCQPVKEGTPPMVEPVITRYLNRLRTQWDVIENRKLQKRFPFENFKRSMAFAQEVALMAERENHHPDLCIHYTHVDVELGTHSIMGLSENDFVMAAKIDAI